jgi:abortive infection bacteriophage resistance protein
MVPMHRQFRAWKCPICNVECRRLSNQQQYVQMISLLDQLIASTTDQKTKKMFEERLKEAKAHFEHCKKLEIIGIVFEDTEEWTFHDS